MAEFKDFKDMANQATTAVSDFTKGFTDKNLLNIANERFQNADIGGARRYQSEKYKTATHQYPSDLFSNIGQYGDNYVVFYINVPSESKLAKGETFDLTSMDTTSLKGAIGGAGYSALSTVASTAASGTVIGAALGLPKSGVVFSAVTGGGMVSSMTGGDIQNNALKSMRQMRRLKETITLNVPNNLTTRYSMNYADEDMFAQAAIADTMAGGGEAMGKFAAADGGSARKAGGQAANTTAGMINAAAGVGLGTPGTGSFASAASGLAVNPKKEQVFKNVDFRTFSFEYQFAPRNAKESEEVKKIIKAFKLHMHPEYKDTNAYLFLYPSEFDIVYYQGNSENLNIPRHTSCVLAEMTVNYTPNNQFSTFGDGTPNIINMTLVFKELAILTKDQIMDGF